MAAGDGGPSQCQPGSRLTQLSERNARAPPFPCPAAVRRNAGPTQRPAVRARQVFEPMLERGALPRRRAGCSRFRSWTRLRARAVAGARQVILRRGGLDHFQARREETAGVFRKTVCHFSPAYLNAVYGFHFAHVVSLHCLPGNLLTFLTLGKYLTFLTVRSKTNCCHQLTNAIFVLNIINYCQQLTVASLCRKYIHVDVILKLRSGIGM